jgi:hypothetical protein
MVMLGLADEDLDGCELIEKVGLAVEVGVRVDELELVEDWPFAKSASTIKAKTRIVGQMTSETFGIFL